MVNGTPVKGGGGFRAGGVGDTPVKDGSGLGAVGGGECGVKKVDGGEEAEKEVSIYQTLGWDEDIDDLI